MDTEVFAGVSIYNINPVQSKLTFMHWFIEGIPVETTPDGFQGGISYG
jgi:hypothetical protein